MTRQLSKLSFAFVLWAVAHAQAQVLPDRPNVITFPAQKARFVRFIIRESSQGEPCIDELEVYSPGDDRNLALAAHGGRATASSCLPGYAIHKIAHLNDGKYGNAHSWIAAGKVDEWAQIELAEAAEIDRVIFSRDRPGRYRDRVPTRFEVALSMDGKAWRTVRRIRIAGIPVIDDGATWEERVQYAFACEAASFRRIDRRQPVTRVLDQLADMIRRFEARGLDAARARNELGELRRRQEAAVENSEAAQKLLMHARWAKRRLFLSDPDLQSINKILFVKRHPFRPSHNYSVILDAQGKPGGAVCILETPFGDDGFKPRNARLNALFDAGAGVARNPMADFAARRIYFAHMKTKGDYYRLMVMNADGSGVKRLTDGPWHDYWPCPLPDGGLAFISTRCQCRFLCWRPQAFVLFRMDSSGRNIRPLSFANLSEWAPSVMRDGRIIWTRSEYLDKGADFGHTLWAIRPDGSHPDMLFGNNTINCYANGREVPGTNEFCCTLISHGGDLNGPIALIDGNRGRFNPKAITSITPDVPYHTHMSWAQQSCFRDPVPISRDLFLCSHAPKRCFGLYVIDRHGNREVIYFDPAMSSMCPTPFRPVKAPPVIPPEEPATVASRQAQGEFLVVDIYQGLPETVKRGSIRYLRVCQEVRSGLAQLPDGQYRNDHEPFQDFYASPTHKVTGPHGWPSYVAKGTFGLARVEPDGSAHFYAPAGKVLYFEALDENFNEVQRMRSVVQLQPGERRSCIGCHEGRSLSAPRHHGTALRRPPEALMAPPWGTGAFSYEKVVQPVWDAHCVRCHDAKDAKGMNLTGKRDAERIPASYRTLIQGGWVHYFNYHWGQEHSKAKALTFGTVKSKLIPLLEGGHEKVKLSRDDMRRIKCWIDLNCPLWPDYKYRLDRPLTAVHEKQDAGAGLK